MTQKQSRKQFKWYYLLVILLIPIFAVTYYLNTSYPSSDYANSFMTSHSGVEVLDNGNIHFEPENSNGKGLIFYPGGKVEPESYAPILFALAERGYDCFIVKMPFNLAVFNSNGAMNLVGEYDHIDSWYIAGHSLGGVMAANCVLENPDIFEGIIFMASYPADNKSLSQLQSLRTLSFYGSQDGFVPLSSQSKHIGLLPAHSKIVEITGGNHSQFGSYGFQKGDQEAEISEEEQHSQIVQEIDKWLSEEE